VSPTLLLLIGLIVGIALYAIITPSIRVKQLRLDLEATAREVAAHRATLEEQERILGALDEELKSQRRTLSNFITGGKG
jgi:hypothetical protein